MEVHRFGQYLINCGVVNEDNVYDALNIQLKRRATIGQIAIKEEKLTVKQVMKVLYWQAGTAKLFGEIAVENEYLTRDDIHELINTQADRQPRIGEILVEMGKVERESLDQLLQAYHKTLGSAPPATSYPSS